MKLYPITVNLRGKRVAVVGGGVVAERKIRSILGTEAEILVISPDVTENIRLWANEGKLELFLRAFQPDDVQHADLVIAATNDPATNLRVHQSTNRHQWINVVDRPELCTFHVPAVLQRGALQIAISTSGLSPGFSKKLKEWLTEMIGPEFEEYVLFLGEVRKTIHHLNLDSQTKNWLYNKLLEDVFWRQAEAFRAYNSEQVVRELLQKYGQISDHGEESVHET